jgi:hypothetical protein
MENFKNYLVIAWWIFLIALVIGFFTMVFVWWWLNILEKAKNKN